MKELPKLGLEHLWSTRIEPEALANGRASTRSWRSCTSGCSPTPPPACHAWPSEVLSAPDRYRRAQRQIEVPTLVLYGEHDDGWPAETQSEMAGAGWSAECMVHPRRGPLAGRGGAGDHGDRAGPVLERRRSI